MLQFLNIERCIALCFKNTLRISLRYQDICFVKNDGCLKHFVREVVKTCNIERLTQTGTAIGQPEDDVVKGIVRWSGQKANRMES
jgi:hypothetical protein